jgi:hypothetical protein
MKQKQIYIVLLILWVTLLTGLVAHAGTKTGIDSTTTQTYIVKSSGDTLKVYKGAKGGLYVWRQSVKGNFYKQYLKK